ncbi:MAG: iron-containing alcohol dehydrogenase, partial [Nanoarchaeota archaeon]|nr:iron-containing alcohol dehydrogenase [Nanoarchaeota archaeon]
MENFSYQCETKILFGKGTENKVGIETRQWSNRILLHYGGDTIKKIGLYDKIIKSLDVAGVKYFELGGVVPNPRLSLVREGIRLCVNKEIDFILAVGGGSVIDSAKAIASGVPYQGDVWDFFANKVPIGKALPVGVVLTIPAAGSESSPNSVITDEKTKRKLPIGSDILRPKFAIMDPELTFSLPQSQTAAGIADMYAHIIERYFSNTDNTDLTDKMCEAVMCAIIKNAKL